MGPNQRGTRERQVISASVSNAVAADTAEIVSLNQQFHLPIPDFRWTTLDFVSDQIERGNYYVLRDGLGIAAAMCWYPLPGESIGYVETIAVRKERQQQGLGRRLMAYAEELCSSLALGQLVVESFSDYGLNGFYESCGLLQDAEPGDFHGRQYYRFRKRFSAV